MSNFIEKLRLFAKNDVPLKAGPVIEFMVTELDLNTREELEQTIDELIKRGIIVYKKSIHPNIPDIIFIVSEKIRKKWTEKEKENNM